jgi:hypothetical protein
MIRHHTQSSEEAQQPTEARRPRRRNIAIATATGAALLASAATGVAVLKTPNKSSQQKTEAEAKTERLERTDYIGELSSGGKVITIDGGDTVISLDDAANLYRETVGTKAANDQIVIIESKDPKGGKDPLIRVAVGHMSSGGAGTVLGNKDINLVAKGTYLAEQHYLDGVPYEDLLDSVKPLDTSKSGPITDPEVLRFFTLQADLSTQNEANKIPTYAATGGMTIGVLPVVIH